MAKETRDNRSRRAYLCNLARQLAGGGQAPLNELTREDLLILFEELGSYQVELETQNEELRQIRQRLEEANDNYRSLYDFAPVGYCTLRRDGRVHKINLTACGLLKTPRDKILGKPFAAHLADEAVRPFYLHLRSVIDSREPAAIDLDLAAEPDGPTQVVRLESLPVTSDEGEILCRNAISDITALKQTEASLLLLTQVLEQQVAERTGELEVANRNLQLEVEERRRAEAEARQANQAKSEFLANMSHEIRTPMTVFLGALDHLKQLDRDPAHSRLLELADMSVKQLRSLIDSILDFSKIEARQMELHQEDFELRSCLDETVAMFLLQAREKDLRLETSVGSQVPAWVRGDKARLCQVLTNLVGNAVKFTENGRITISVESRGELLEFSVVDTGIGIPQDKLHLLFRHFSQVDSSLSRRFGGSGLGLAICKGLVLLMGGDIQVESREGEGSRFSFTIPLQPAGEPVAETHDAVRQDSGRDADTVCILVVEDERIIEEIITRGLDKKGWQFDVARSGKEALAKWESGRFDLVFMDVQMPGINGLEATRAIRWREGTSRQRTCIIGLTAHATQQVLSECQEAGMDRVLTKPFQWDDLYAAVEDYLHL